MKKPRKPRPLIAITTTGIGLHIEVLWLDRPTTALITGRARGSLEKYCRRHGIRVHAIPGESKDAAGNVVADHRHVRKFILHSEFVKGSIRAAEKGERTAVVAV